MATPSRSGVFSDGADPRVERFTESISYDQRLAPHDIRGSIAHAEMLAEVGLLTADEGRQIVAALTDIGHEIAAGKMAFRQELEDKRGIAESLEKLAGLAASQDHWQQATELFGAAERLREAIASPLPPMEQAGYDSAVTALRSQLSEEAFVTAWRDGRAMPLEQAIEAALDASS